MKKALVVFYSMDEGTKAIAEEIASTIKADVLRLVTKSEAEKRYYQHAESPDRMDELEIPEGEVRYIWGVESVDMNEAPALEDFELNPSNYDLVIVGTPVWSLNYAPPLNSFFSKVSLEGKKVAFFCTHEGMIGSTFKTMEKELESSVVIDVIDFQNVSMNLESNLKKAQDWAKSLIMMI